MLKYLVNVPLGTSDFVWFSDLMFTGGTKREHWKKINKKTSVRNYIFNFSYTWIVKIFIRLHKDVIAEWIQSKCRKIPTRITPNTDTFHAVSEPCQIYMMELFAKIVHGLLLKIILQKATTWTFDRVLNTSQNCTLFFTCMTVSWIQN